MSETKPLNWTPAPGIGYTVTRRPDGSMHYVFTALDPATIKHWRDFSAEHLLDADRLTRNLYDLRHIKDIPEDAIRTAIEVNSDPAARYIRLAVVVANEKVRTAIQEIASAALPEMSAAIRIFTDINEAETWLSRLLDQIV